LVERWKTNDDTTIASNFMKALSQLLLHLKACPCLATFVKRMAMLKNLLIVFLQK
jgi:hypothetical protein